MGVRVRAVVHADVEDRRLLVVSLGDRAKVHRLLEFQRLVKKLSLALVRFCLRVSGEELLYRKLLGRLLLVDIEPRVVAFFDHLVLLVLVFRHEECRMTLLKMRKSLIFFAKSRIAGITNAMSV